MRWVVVLSVECVEEEKKNWEVREKFLSGQKRGALGEAIPDKVSLI